MNSVIVFFVGSAVFCLTYLIKIPIKKFNMRIASHYSDSVNHQRRVYRRMNFTFIILALIMSVIVYYCVLLWLGDTHFKLCCPIKAWATSLAIYSIYEQLFGEDSKIKKRLDDV